MYPQKISHSHMLLTRLNRFHPGYLTADRLSRAAGIGSDHVDLDAVNKTRSGITVAEITNCNVVSVAEHNEHAYINK